MASRHHEEVLERLLDRHGLTYADELAVPLADAGPSALFRMLVASLLMSARISDRIAVAAARALFERGYTTPRRMLDASWQDRVDALGEGHYVRYDESTATYLADTSTLLLDRYGGDLRRLRDAADGDPQRVAELVQACKGIGAVGAAIFCREVQRAWHELRPFVDDAALDVARTLGLPDSPGRLASLAGGSDLSVVAAALVRAKLGDDLHVVRDGGEAPPTDVQLQRMTREDLYHLARRLDVPHRSSMTRSALVEAVRDRALPVS